MAENFNTDMLADKIDHVGSNTVLKLSSASVKSPQGALVREKYLTCRLI